MRGDGPDRARDPRTVLHSSAVMIQATQVKPVGTVADGARSHELRGQELATALRQRPDLTGIDLSGADLDGADLSGLALFKGKLRGASLRGAKLDGAELSGADLEGADLERASARGAGLGHANLRDVRAFEADLSDATLSGADLTQASFHCATLGGARLREATLAGADFRAADLRNAELSRATVKGTCFDDADLRGARLRALVDFESAHWYGTDLRDINFAGAYRLRRHAADENYLREFREAGRLEHAIYVLWRLTSDCGRSLRRWTAMIVAVAVLFAALYAVVGLDVGGHAAGAVTYLYFSVVTLTTLGYGDVLPASAVGQLLVVLEVCVGYMMLGGLISILANKMARRSE